MTATLRYVFPTITFPTITSLLLRLRHPVEVTQEKAASVAVIAAATDVQVITIEAFRRGILHTTRCAPGDQHHDHYYW